MTAILLGSNAGWTIGWAIGLTVVFVVVALVVPILRLAQQIGDEATERFPAASVTLTVIT